MLYREWKRTQRANTLLKRELREWQDKFLQKVNTSPLFTPPPKPVEQIDRPPIGATAKKAYLAAHASPNEVPSAEQILAAAEKARNGNQ